MVLTSYDKALLHGVHGSMGISLRLAIGFLQRPGQINATRA